MNLKIKILNENCILPTRGSDKAGGWDIYASEIIKEADNFYKVKTGFALQPPTGYKITIVPRSSLTKTNWIINNSPILGDEDYTGEYEIRFRGIPISYDNFIPLGIIHSTNSSFNLVYDEFPFTIGDRIAQLYLEEVIDINFEVVNELQETNRGSGGFGSTGK